jgi:hypothetical protein
MSIKYLKENIVTITDDQTIAIDFLNTINFLNNHIFGIKSAIGRINITNTTQYQLKANRNVVILISHKKPDL